MNFTSMSGGLMFVALGAVWFLFFIPSWSNRSVEKEQARNELEEVKQEARQEFAKLNAGVNAKSIDRKRRALLVRRVSTFVAFVSLGIAGWSSTLVISSPLAWIGVGAGAMLLTGAIGVSRAASKAYKNSLTESLGRRRVRSFAYGGQTANTDVSFNQLSPTSGLPDNSWAAQGVPSQIFRGSEGSLVDVRFAEVVELAPVRSEQTLESETLDEILRRRRANG
jgi:hypothetical protein